MVKKIGRQKGIYLAFLDLEKIFHNIPSKVGVGKYEEKEYKNNKLRTYRGSIYTVIWKQGISKLWMD